MATEPQPNPRPPGLSGNQVPPGGPTPQGKPAFPPGHVENAGAAPQLGKNPHLGQSASTSTNLAK